MLSPEQIRARLAEVQRQVGPDVTVVAATKYVSLADMGSLAEAGVTVVGENRAQDLEAKHAEYGDSLPLALHRSAAVEQGEGRESHLRARAFARLGLGGPAARGARARAGQPGGGDVEGWDRAG